MIGDSGFASELCLSGWPIILIRSRLQPINSPVLDSYIKIFEISKIKNIIDANSSNLNYINHMVKIGKNLIQDCGISADKKLIKILDIK